MPEVGELGYLALWRHVVAPADIDPDQVRWPSDGRPAVQTSGGQRRADIERVRVVALEAGSPSARRGIRLSRHTPELAHDAPNLTRHALPGD